MKYSNREFDSASIMLLKGIESDFVKLVSDVLQKADYSSLTLAYNISIESLAKKGKTDKRFFIDSNESFSLSGSNDIIAKVNSFFNTKITELNSCLKIDECLLITINFSKKDKEALISNPNDTKKQTDNMSDISFIPTNPIHDFSQIILSQEIKDEIFDALNVINFQSLIYHDWGFEEVDPIPKSVLNFYGPPGTGKTMCAHAIAKKMGKKLLALNYAEIESKYVGEAPKNLMKAFETAKQNDCILFFDEADSFLGKRIQNVTHGSEQALNSLRSQMLILLEEFNGIVLFATNLVTNFDKAFESRILKHIKFELPNQEARCEIINKMLPQKLPLQHKFTDDEFTELSKVCEGFSGREIKGAILETLLNKASTEQENAVFTFDDFNKSFLKKAESMKKLREEATNNKKAKIIKALSSSNLASEGSKNSAENNTAEKEVTETSPIAQ